MKILRNILFLFIVTNLYANISDEQLKNAIKSNPNLLNTPQAQAEMQKRGISQDAILSKLNKDKSEEIDDNKKVIINDVDLSDKSDKTNKEKSKVKDNKKYIFNNPLRYEENSKILLKIKENQNIKSDDEELKRFSEIFFKNKNALDSSTLPIPSFYEVNIGDQVSIWIYGAKNENYQLLVDSNGRINIPKIGPISVKGSDFDTLKNVIKSKLKPTFKNSQISVNISALSTLQVNLVGFVKAPGVYNISPLSTIKDLLILAGGTKANGSVRNISIKRDGKTYKKIDLYKLLASGDDKIDTILKANDTIYVPKAEKLVSLDGEVESKAIFELIQSETLETLVDYSGGIKSSSSKFGLRLKRFESNENLKVLKYDINDAKGISLKDGDSVYIYPINKNTLDAISLLGNVVKPGDIELIESKSLQELLSNEIIKRGMEGVFLNNTLFSYALIKRLDEDLENEVISFNLEKVLNKEIDIQLEKNDKIFIFNKLDSNLNPYVSIDGNQVLKPGKYQYVKGLKINDIVSIAGIKREYTHVRITTIDDKSHTPINITFDKSNFDKYSLKPFDEIYLFDLYNENNVKTISISGEVIDPNIFFYSKKLTLKELVSLAGGFNSKAYKKECEIIRYEIVNDVRRSKLIKVNLEDNIDIILQPYDEVHIKKIPFWNNRKTVKIEGEVLFPGEYVINDGDKLEDVIRRAGGYTKNAFLQGAVFTREKIKELQKKNMEEAILKLKQKLLSLSIQPASIGEGTKESNPKEMMILVESLENDAKKYEPVGRISIRLEKDLNEFSSSTSNLTLEDKDTIIIPPINDTVLVLGEVMSPTAIIFDSTHINDYINSAGGVNQRADTDKVYIVHANGSSTQVDFGWFYDSGTTIEKGDVVVVPQELVTYSGLQIAKDISSIFYQFALTAAAMHTVGAL